MKFLTPAFEKTGVDATASDTTAARRKALTMRDIFSVSFHPGQFAPNWSLGRGSRQSRRNRRRPHHSNRAEASRGLVAGGRTVVQPRRRRSAPAAELAERLEQVRRTAGLVAEQEGSAVAPRAI